jgi:hypothetical protein
MDSDRAFNLKVRLFIVLALTFFGFNVFALDSSQASEALFAENAKSHLMKFLIMVADAEDFTEQPGFNEFTKTIAPLLTHEAMEASFRSSPDDDFHTTLRGVALMRIEGQSLKLLGSKHIVIDKAEPAGEGAMAFVLRPYLSTVVHSYELKCARTIEKGFFGASETVTCSIGKINRNVEFGFEQGD